MEDMPFTLLRHPKGGATLLEELNDPPVERACVSSEKWEAIEQTVYATFWEQRKRMTESTERWGSIQLPKFRWGRTVRLLRVEGKELLVLLWGIELATLEQIPAALINWKGLAQEERWWLATQTGGVRGHPQFQADRGWRKALYHILVENPVSI